MTWQPSNPDWQAKTRAGYAAQVFMETVGARLDVVAPGRVVISAPFADRLTQGNGFLHAGVVTTLLDNACGWSAFTLMAPGKGVLTVEFKVNLLRPAVGERLVADAKVIKPGRVVTVCAGEAVMERGGERALVATMTATLIATDEG